MDGRTPISRHRCPDAIDVYCPALIGVISHRSKAAMATRSNPGALHLAISPNLRVCVVLAQRARPAIATTKRASGEIVSFTLLNEPKPARDKVLELLDGWFDRWLVT